MSSSFSRLTTLPPRPPTPPRDISKDVDHALQFLEQGHDERAHDVSRTEEDDFTSTPPARAASSSGASTSKKVDFLDDIISHDEPQRAQSSSPAGQTSKQPPLSTQGSKPLKSILKATNSNTPPTPEDIDTRLSYFSPSEPGSFHRMLQSILRQLAAPSRSERLDAYQAINGTLKTYDGVPDPQVIVEKIGVLTQFLARDMAWKDNGSLDRTIVIAALQLTSALCLDSRISHALDHDFRSFILDRCMMVLEQDGMAKDIIKSHILLLCQRFPPSVLTQGRVEKLLAALHTITDRCSGNSVVSARLVVYQRLVEQAPAPMLNRMRDWIEHIFHGALSNNNDTRARAIECCTYAGLKLGSQPPASKAVCELCETETETGQSYGDYFCDRLKQMSKDRQAGIYVPQIWAAITLFFRSKRRPIDKWSKMKIWLTTIQECLNSGDINVKQQANKAWGKLVFSVMPDSSTSESMRSMLKVPIVAGLERRANDRLSQQHRQIALDSYCNLLHYAFRPGLTYVDVDIHWDLYVGPVLLQMSNSSRQGATTVCRIIHGLLQKTNGIWNGNAANEIGNITPEELPRLEPRWVRSRVDKIITLLEPILSAYMWSPMDGGDTVSECWRLLTEAIAEAGSQEVKTSNDLKETIAHLTGLTRRLWRSASASPVRSEGTVWVENYQRLLDTMFTVIGIGHFGEDVLTKSSNDEVEVAPTPSQLTAKQRRSAYSPFMFWLALHYQPPLINNIDSIYGKLLPWLLYQFSQAKPSTSASLALLRRSLQSCAELRVHDVSAELESRVWVGLADCAINVLDTGTPTSPHRSAQSMGDALRSGIELLLEGMRLSASWAACVPKLTDLCSALCKAAMKHAGDGGAAVGVIEPLAKAVNDLTAPSLEANIMICKAMLEHGTWPKTRQSLDQSRKALWAVSLELPRSSVFDPFKHFYTLLTKTMDLAYGNFDTVDALSNDPSISLFKAWRQFLQRSPTTTAAAVLSRMADCLTPWIEDHDGKVFVSVDQAEVDVTDTKSEIYQTWSVVLRVVLRFPEEDTVLLRSLEHLISAGMSSPSQRIVNKTIMFWNSTFGTASQLEYPKSLEPILRARRLQTELFLPGLTADGIGDDIADLPDLVETQSDQKSLERSSKQPEASRASLTPKTGRASTLNHSLIRHRINSSLSPATHGIVAESGHKRGGSNPKAKLRHEDSQIQFEPIELSSKTSSQDSQDSQLLTDRQKEVKARQHGDAQMYPDMSSSPAHRPRRLDFSAGSIDILGPREFATPTGAEIFNPMSDDLPSSPTPRTPATVDQQTEHNKETVYDGVEEYDPPSSPPGQEDAAEAPALESDQDTTEAMQGDDGEYRTADPGDHSPDIESTGRFQGNSNDFDLQAVHALVSDHARQEVDEPFFDEVIPTTQLDDDDQAATQGNDARDQHLIDEDGIDDSQYVEDSLLDSQAETQSSAQPLDSSSRMPIKVSRKRKRSSRIVYTAKRRKQASTLEKVFASFVEPSQEEEKELEEEIVVVPRKPKAEARSPVSGVDASQNEERIVDRLDSIAQCDEAEDYTKRRRGRPRKTDALPAKDAGAVLAGCKRNASAMDDASTNLPAETGVRTRGRRQREEQDDELSKDGQSTQDSSRSWGPSRRVAAVVVSRSQEPAEPPADSLANIDAESGKEEEDEDVDVDVVDRDPSDDDSPTAEKQLAEEHQAAISKRKIAQPKSILGRLRGILGDCKKMVLGPQEEREFDDMLFEIRREIHQASVRAKED